MYTQCPECGVAFRITAEVLKMAAGQVRCGGCGVAFNALEHLSEQKPVTPVQIDQPANPDLPELSPDEPGELEADTSPQTISAEQSAALLKTLDQLAGEDIRIEDTGVEWRVLSEGEDEESDDEAESFEQASDEPSRVIDEMLFDDNTVLPDDFDEVVDAPSPSPPASPLPAEPEAEAQAEEPQFDLDLSEPDEWEDLLGDFETPDVVIAEAEEPVVPSAEEQPEDDLESGEDPLDMDTQFAIQAEAMGIDLSGVHEVDGEEETDQEPGLALDEEPEEVPDEDPDEDSETSIEEDLMAAAFETEEAGQSMEESIAEEDLDEDDLDVDEEVDIDLQAEDEEETEDDVDDIARGFDDKVEEDIATLSIPLDDESEDAVPTTSEEHVIPEMSEEEKTINMMIDEELFNVAVEDEDGFASTIVQLQPDTDVDDEIKGTKKKSHKKDKKKKKKDKEVQPPLEVETIIMEGEAILGEFEKEQATDDGKTAEAGMNDPGLSLPLNREKDDYARRREMTSAPTGTSLYVGIVALILLLVVQAVHQSREALATVPAFNSAVGPIYRMLGKPLTPTWNIAGWRFEATKGDTDESGKLLTIYSRIGNNSDEALPYPLVHLSLTDRFEDVIGSVVLEPGEFLPENADPRKLVPPGNTFNAVISIDSPSEDATGFKLNVCYRLASGQLRCADHDFK
jgi:predicted Zn finger-like uncharacterized protein